MDDVIPVASRRQALAEWQQAHQRFFNPDFLREGLELFAITPEAAMRKGIYTYFEAVEKLFPRVVQFWKDHGGGNNNTIPNILLNGTMQIDAFLKPGNYTDSSVNDMWLYKMKLNSPQLQTLADGRNMAIIKSQSFNTATVEELQSLFEFTNEILVTRLLNCLVTSFRYTVTPHFTVFMGMYVAPEMTLQTANDPNASLFERAMRSLRSFVRAPTSGPFVIDTTSAATSPLRVQAIYERADESFNSVLPRLLQDRGFTPAHLGSLLFQVLSAFEAASRVLGYTHNDAHSGNIMVRSVVGTPYENRVWGYKRALEDDYYFIDPSEHGNLMVEIIDQGRATIAKIQPTNNASASARFSVDAARVFEGLTYFMAPYLNNGMLQRRNNWMNAIVQLEAVNVNVTDFINQWAGDSLSTLFGTFRDTIAPDRPIIMSIVPNTNILSATNNTESALVVETLQGAWKIRSGMKRALPLACAVPSSSPRQCPVCLSENVKYETEDLTAFCGIDCYRVHYGVYETC